MDKLQIRYVAAIVAIALLAALLYWQHRREAVVADCREIGGRWDGPNSTCRLPPTRILSRPGLDRG